MCRAVPSSCKCKAVKLLQHNAIAVQYSEKCMAAHSMTDVCRLRCSAVQCREHCSDTTNNAVQAVQTDTQTSRWTSRKPIVSITVIRHEENMARDTATPTTTQQKKMDEEE